MRCRADSRFMDGGSGAIRWTPACCSSRRNPQERAPSVPPTGRLVPTVNKGTAGFFVVFAVAACGGLPRIPATSGPVWSDEFDGAAGTSFDSAKWVADIGGHGFGNRERQFY